MSSGDASLWPRSAPPKVTRALGNAVLAGRAVSTSWYVPDVATGTGSVDRAGRQWRIARQRFEPGQVPQFGITA